MSSIFEEAIESWEYARRGVLSEAEGIPDESYGFRPHENARSVAELLIHVIESSLMMVGELRSPDGDFTRKSYPEFIAEYAGDLPSDPSPATLKELLGSTLEAGVAKFRDTGETHMLESIRRFDGELWSRLTWMHHGIAHEEYHRGQLATYARALGLVPALTRMIYGDAAE